jgi:plasmid stabilization system protein ParE
MSLRIRRSEWFIGDLEHYAAWHESAANWEVAEQYLRAVSATLTRIAEMPGLGRPVRFSNPILRDLRCFPVERPFEKHLIFYRNDQSTLCVERVVHGARDLPRRLTNHQQQMTRRFLSTAILSCPC